MAIVIPFGMRNTDPKSFDINRKKVSGKWKPIILFMLYQKPERFNKIKQLAIGITSAELTKNLKQMISNGLVVKTEDRYGLTQEAELIALHLFEIKKIVDGLP